MKKLLSSLTLASSVALVATGCGKTHADNHQQASAPTTATPLESLATNYTCPMHPEVTDTRPSACPKCGMKLVPVQPKGGAKK